MTPKLAQLLLLVALVDRVVLYSRIYNDDYRSEEFSDESNVVDQYEEDEGSEESDEENIFEGAQLDFSEYEDFYDIEKSALALEGAAELGDAEGGTGTTEEALQWPRTGNRVVIPYEIDRNSRYSASQKRNIKQAMREIESRTCIEFTKRGLERNFIKFKSNPSKGCSSKLGMQEGGQDINLNKRTSCAKIPGIIMHEILHSLGFHHMHSHTQRDKYINILWHNIEPRKNSNYMAIQGHLVSSFGTKYDFYSIMHYPPKNAEGKRVIRPKPQFKYYDKYMGQRRTLSDGDVQRINTMYGCNRHSRGFSSPRFDPNVNTDSRHRPTYEQHNNDKARYSYAPQSFSPHQYYPQNSGNAFELPKHVPQHQSSGFSLKIPNIFGMHIPFNNRNPN